ncbi:MAG: hypothetical protein E2O48_01950 [Gemmatimonadetes bacterium]|nr:MAG: hypothetical protein E2O48_01950 [Gemmatimonadota bacterium]
MTRTTWRVPGSSEDKEYGGEPYGREMRMALPMRCQRLRVWRNTLIINSANITAVHALKPCRDNMTTISR